MEERMNKYYPTNISVREQYKLAYRWWRNEPTFIYDMYWTIDLDVCSAVMYAAADSLRNHWDGETYLWCNTDRETRFWLLLYQRYPQHAFPF